MTEAIAPVDVVETKPKYPTLTNDEKLAIREAQFVLTNTREQAMQAVQAAEQNLNKAVFTLGQKYNLNPKKTQLNSQTLEFIDTP